MSGVYGRGGYLIFDLCGCSGRITLIRPGEDLGIFGFQSNGFDRVAEPPRIVGEQDVFVKESMALGFSVSDDVKISRDFSLPALLEEEEEEEEESLGSNSTSVVDHGDESEVLSDDESGICNYSDEDIEEIDALLINTGDDEEWAEEDSLKGCGIEKGEKLRRTFERLRRIVGADCCMDTAAVFEEAIRYVKALQVRARNLDFHDNMGIVLDS